MKNKWMTGALSLFLLIGAVVFLCFGYVTVFVLLLALWYLLYGFTSPAYAACRKKQTKQAIFWLSVTVPYFLLPPYRTIYYWTRAMVAIDLNRQDAAKALSYMDRAKPQSLLREEDRSLFYFYKACLCVDVRNLDEALRCYKAAVGLPHSRELAKQYKKILPLLRALQQEQGVAGEIPAEV
ncbi:hypothetical protein [Feifania hominis]|uniref:Tetratricopeptide repeat protein n=1 Tax=Feifania hominis TaxID=2763660 RepID=A0A926HU96_9FIRM|nr:hypothetical protein [Feifania hominis]MBC8535311.1 hypothetical protein [Feifania hominis]